MFPLKMSLQVGGASHQKSLSTLLTFASIDLLVFSNIEYFDFFKLLVDMTKVQLWFLALRSRTGVRSL